MLKKILGTSSRRTVVYPTPVQPDLASGSLVENGGQLQLSVVPAAVATTSRSATFTNNVRTREANRINIEDGIDRLLCKEASLLSITPECEQPKGSQNVVDHEHFQLVHREKISPPGRSCDKNLLELQVDELVMGLDALDYFGDKGIGCTTDNPIGLLEPKKSKSGAAAQPYEQELQMYKAEADMQSEMLARKEQQLWEDELLARWIQKEDLEEGRNTRTQISSSYYDRTYDLFFAEARDDRPYVDREEGRNTSTQISSSYNDKTYDLFFAVARDDRAYVGVGCVMKDVKGYVVFETRECLGVAVSHHFAEYTALINGLAYARSMGVRRINAYGNPAFMYWEVQGLADNWTSEQLQLLNAMHEQVKELDSFNIDCVSKTENEDAINLAKCAIAADVAQVNKKSSNLSLKGKACVDEEEAPKECRICFEKIFASDMVFQKACGHQFCFNCLAQHVENEILAGRVPVRCPQYFMCATHMGLHDCQRLLSPKGFDVYASRLTEATISDSEKVYCPYPNCSAMMCRNDDTETTTMSTSSSNVPPERARIGGAECMECHRLFCVECQVPWHGNLTCEQYQRLPSDERDAEFIKLSQLAKDENWRRCKQCRRMIILAHGCIHMTCRCGYEFCYTCETAYQNRKKMCKCPLFPTIPGWARTR